ncbi:hypothetical protein L3Q82_018461 [Scortum barcoo]|uniref:Uncharacterized protein n=1 Tax=Scortum barcoo TaxID=214431 RepID=A0ACB8VEM3_9TELE|nr:hypothetical protein L3Q82_018461 [Scortum barcoo]
MQRREELLEGLPQVSPEEKAALHCELTLEDLTMAVHQMASGRAPGIDGLSTDFLKRFWNTLGPDLHAVLLECFGTGSLPVSCQQAVLSLLPKKGNLALLKNWRPVSLLCTDYKGKSSGCQQLGRFDSLAQADCSDTTKRPGRGCAENHLGLFWFGKHWIQAAALYLPVVEGDRFSSTSSPESPRSDSCGPGWLDTARLLLRRAGRLFLLQPEDVDLTGLTPFYSSVLQAWQSTVDKLIKKTNLALVISTHSWREQFVEAVTVSAGDGDDDEEGREERLPSCYDYVMHFLTVFWKVLFACVPPTEYWNGWACFLVSISVIGLLTAVIGDLASHFGCTIGLRDTVTAVVFVALGTSIPDTFASKVAAIQDQHADASVGNVTGSNAVNVFLGIGVAWSVAAVYWRIKGKEFTVDPGSLAFSVTLFTIFAFICMAVLLFRRRPSIGGELGGPRVPRLLTSLLFLGLWFLYILFSSLEAYCHITGF